MRRADRLFHLLDVLRRRRKATGVELAEELEISLRTLYRDIADLIAQNVPIRGEAGVGYMLEKGFDMPPLMFREEEVEALALGAQMVKAWSDPELARAAEQALARIEAVLPERLRSRVRKGSVLAPDFHIPRATQGMLGVLRSAMHARFHVSFAYSDRAGTATRRVVRPLGLFYWGSSWSLGAWCELRTDFRNFRVDRMKELRTETTVFVLEQGRTLEDFLSTMRG